MPLENKSILRFEFAKPDGAAVSIASCLVPAERRAHNHLASTLPVAAERDSTENGSLLHPRLTVPTKVRHTSLTK